MSTSTQQVVSKAWNFAHVLRDDGLSYMAYVEQITFLLFLKMADEQGVIAPVPRIMRLFWAFSLSNPPESPSQEESSLANMPDTLEARCRSDGPPAGPRSIDPLPGSRSFLTVSAVA